MARPVHRLMWTPSAFFRSASDGLIPAMVTMTPYTTKRPPMIVRMSNSRAAVADFRSRSETSLCRSDMVSYSDQNE